MGGSERVNDVVGCEASRKLDVVAPLRIGEVLGDDGQVDVELAACKASVTSSVVIVTRHAPYVQGDWG